MDFQHLEMHKPVFLLEMILVKNLQYCKKKHSFPHQKHDYSIQKDWKTGLYLEGQRRFEILHPEYGNNHWLQMIRNSFKSHIMTPYTSYIVVENDAQKAMLYKKQKEVLSGNKNLDLEEVVNMTEPSIWWFLIGFIGFLIWRKKCQ